MRVSLKSFISIVYFLVNGQVGYVIPRFKNKIYKVIATGDTFGDVDLAEYIHQIELRDRTVHLQSEKIVHLTAHSTGL